MRVRIFPLSAPNSALQDATRFRVRFLCLFVPLLVVMRLLFLPVRKRALARFASFGLVIPSSSLVYNQ